MSRGEFVARDRNVASDRIVVESRNAAPTVNPNMTGGRVLGYDGTPSNCMLGRGTVQDGRYNPNGVVESQGAEPLVIRSREALEHQVRVGPHTHKVPQGEGRHHLVGSQEGEGNVHLPLIGIPRGDGRGGVHHHHRLHRPHQHPIRDHTEEGEGGRDTGHLQIRNGK